MCFRHSRDYNQCPDVPHPRVFPRPTVDFTSSPSSRRHNERKVTYSAWGSQPRYLRPSICYTPGEREGRVSSPSPKTKPPIHFHGSKDRGSRSSTFPPPSPPTLITSLVVRTVVRDPCPESLCVTRCLFYLFNPVGSTRRPGCDFFPPRQIVPRRLRLPTLPRTRRVRRYDVDVIDRNPTHSHGSDGRRRDCPSVVNRGPTSP